MKGVGQRSLTAAKWNVVGNLFKVGMQFIVGIILARVIGPQEFGLVAVAILLVGFGQMFVDFGFNAAIVQVKELREDEFDALGTLQILVGALMTFCTIMSADLVARFFGQPAAGPVVAGMAWMFFLRALGQNALALLNRDLRFRAVQFGGTLGYTVGYLVIGIPLAYAGWGAWSLVCAQLVQSGTTSILAIMQAGRFPRATFHRPPTAMLRYGGFVLTANLGSWALVNIDAVVVGHVAGPTNLAYYNRSVTLAAAPVQALLSGLQPVLFSATARAQDNPDGCRRALYTCFAATALIACPLLFAVAAVPSAVLSALYGPQWAYAATLLTPLCLAAVLNGFMGFLGPVIMGVGYIERETRAQWMSVFIMLPLLYLAGGVSTLAVAWIVVPLSGLRTFLLFHALNGVLPLRAKDIVRAILPGLIVGVFAALGASFCDNAMNVASAGLQLLGVVAGAAAGTAIGTFLTHRLILQGPLAYALLSSDVIPNSLKSWIEAVRTRSK